MGSLCHPNLGPRHHTSETSPQYARPWVRAEPSTDTPWIARPWTWAALISPVSGWVFYLRPPHATQALNRHSSSPASSTHTKKLNPISLYIPSYSAIYFSKLFPLHYLFHDILYYIPINMSRPYPNHPSHYYSKQKGYIFIFAFLTLPNPSHIPSLFPFCSISIVYFRYSIPTPAIRNETLPLSTTTLFSSVPSRYTQNDSS